AANRNADLNALVVQRRQLSPQSLDLRAVADLDRDTDLRVVERLDARTKPLDLRPVADVDRDGDPRALQRGELSPQPRGVDVELDREDRKSTRLNSSHVKISYAV